MGIYQQNNSYFIRWTDENGKRRKQKAGYSEAQARKLLTKREEESRRFRLFPEEKPRPVVTVAEAIARFLPMRRLECPASYKEDIRYQRYWTDALGELPLASVVPGDVSKWRAARSELGNKPATINRAVGFLKTIFFRAIDDKLFAGPNPCSKVKDLEENNERVRFLLQGERQALSEIAWRRPRGWDLIRVGYLTGMRQGEQVAVRREHINFNQGLLTVPKSKTGEKRHVSLSSEALEILSRWLNSHTSEWVFPGRFETGHIAQSTLIKTIEFFCEQANVQDFHWHDLRHDYCSQLTMAGVPLRTIQVLAGHKSIKTTERYAHLSPTHLLEAVEKLVGKTPSQGPLQGPIAPQTNLNSPKNEAKAEKNARRKPKMVCRRPQKKPVVTGFVAES